MKNKLIDNRKIRIALIALASFAVFLLIFNLIIMPWYVSGSEIPVPNVKGMNEEAARQLLEDNNLEPVNAGERYDDKSPRGTVIFQRPSAGSVVKENRRIFLFISSGVPFIKVPELKGKYLRDAQLTLERMDLMIGDTNYIQSESPRGVIVDQQIAAGTDIKQGSRINVTLSAGAEIGVLVPDLLGKSLSEAEKLLLDRKLVPGKINYQPSFSLLPNTVIDQYPSKDNTVPEGTAVDLFVTKNVSTPNETNGE